MGIDAAAASATSAPTTSIAAAGAMSVPASAPAALAPAPAISARAGTPLSQAPASPPLASAPNGAAAPASPRGTTDRRTTIRRGGGRGASSSSTTAANAARRASALRRTATTDDDDHAASDATAGHDDDDDEPRTARAAAAAGVRRSRRVAAEDGGSGDGSDDDESDDEDDDDVDDDSDDLGGDLDPATDAVRREAMASLRQIEHDFQRLRHALYDERMNHLRLEEVQIKNGTHPDYLVRRAHLESSRDDRLALAEARRNHALAAARTEFECVRLQLEREFVDARARARLARIREAQRALFQLKAEKRKLDARGPDATSSAPFVDPSSPLSGAAPTRTYLAKRRRRMKLLVDDLRACQARAGGPPVLCVESLTQVEVQNDLFAMQNVHPWLAATAAAGIYMRDHWHLQYRDAVLQRGEFLVVTDTVKGAKFHVTLQQVTESEVICKKSDGSRLRVPMQHLLNNVYLFKRSG
ncbi:hypothetical protein AMAG_08429 [Allomyces macrogynus ATCC 38327]|uniref:Uncharacterized protein n=1 Tax=Allomyces macrogynus (strain ATCC 38327) TaxID=578462 RepID=A0A0L0SLG9_ALLM3|nr:hypothetical protein AMAG_08429 [Allomyces macrogynus ATCC 38327]|eukprot:KNE63288.1 hypothetical protein AMAG_08429 [Allomyces macrogynus ATCC 38327]